MADSPKNYLLHDQPLAGRIALSATGTYYRYPQDVYSETGFFVKADAQNSGDVFMGNTGSALTDKYPLDAGQEVEVNIWNIRALWFVTTAANSAVYFIKK